ncbi:hypothetical protein [Propionivibrio sp.]|nr:hypothetical protein [Propionivibrio sp.]
MKTVNPEIGCFLAFTARLAGTMVLGIKQSELRKTSVRVPP